MSWTYRNIECLANLIFLVNRKQTSVVTLLNSNESDSGLIAALQSQASFSDGSQFMLKNIQELALAYTITVENDSSRLEASVAVELNKKLADHVRKVADQFLKVRMVIFKRLLICLRVYAAEHEQ